MARRRRVRGEDDGFSLAEIMIAMVIMLISIFSLTYILVNSLADTAFARQRSAATNLANQTIEEIRSLPWSGSSGYNLKEGMLSADILASTGSNCSSQAGGCDPNLTSLGCFEGRAVAATDSVTGLPWVSTGGCSTAGWATPGCLSQTPATWPPTLSSPEPISPHQSCYQVGNSQYAVDTYITGSGNLLTASVVVTWGHPFRGGVSNHVVATTDLSPCLRGNSSC